MDEVAEVAEEELDLAQKCKKRLGDTHEHISEKALAFALVQIGVGNGIIKLIAGHR